MAVEIELFESAPPVAQDENEAAHLALYTRLKGAASCAGERSALAAKMREYRSMGLGDPDFVERFPRECGARIWEICLATTLKTWGWELVPARQPGAGPDFGARCTDGSVMWIEATVPRAGAEVTKDGMPNPNKVRVPDNGVVIGSDLDRTIMLRYLNSIDAKRQQWKRWITTGFVERSEGLIVAVSGAMIPEAMSENPGEVPRIIRVLYGIGVPQFSISTGEADIRNEGFGGSA